MTDEQIDIIMARARKLKLKADRELEQLDQGRQKKVQKKLDKPRR